MLKKVFCAAALAMTVSVGGKAADYGLPANIQDGNILHCFDWTCAQVEAELDNIAKAGFGSVQLSPMQGNCNAGAEWYYAYMPYDFVLKGSGVGSKAQLTSLCNAAHQRGIKVIVDVVANHVNKATGYHDTWWDSNGRVRWNGGINYSDRYSITHGQLGDYGDVNSEDSQVQARAKAYVEELKACGVDGIRWDAAKHIGLPSEGCNFWSTVTSVPGMWHYGEILDSPGGNADNVIKEYTKYMSVTDNGYCDGVRNAVKGGGAPSGYAGWAASAIADNKVVYWAESHDDYSNEWQATTHISQAVIDRTWAIVACRNGASSLYLSRPAATNKDAIKMGVKGSTHFTSAEIAAINKLRNTAVGHADYFSSGNGVVSVTRKDVGAAIIKGNGQAGNVSVANGGGYCPAGTYIDQVSGSTFTVTATTISGNVGSTGIAVLIKDGSAPDPGPTPGPDPDPSGTVTIQDDYNLAYSGSHTNVYYWGATNPVTWDAAPAMESATGSDGNTYKVYKLPEGMTHVIFKTGGSQTADLTYTSDYVMNDNGATSVKVVFGNTPVPAKPTVTISPNGGKVKGTAGITVNIANATSVTADFNGKALSLSNGANTVAVSSYLNDGQTGTLTVKATNADGTASAEATFTRSDAVTPPVPGPAGNNLITDYYKVNPDGQFGSNRTVNMQFSSQTAAGALSHWTADDLIAQGVARDVAQAMKGNHERPIVDSYAIYAAYDKDNLYLGVQFVYAVWDIYGEGKQPGESKPYNMDGHMLIAFDLDPEASFDGYIDGKGPIWSDTALGAKFENGVDAVWMGSTKPGVGTPGLFVPTPDGHASYDAPYCKASTVKYGYADGLASCISNVWGQKELNFDASVLEGNDGFVDLRSEIDDSAHTLYEFCFPLSLLGVTEDYIRNVGIGVQYIDKYGTSPVGGTPYDPSFFDNVTGSYSQDPSSSKEKEDEDIITYAPARIGKAAFSAVGDITVEPAGDDSAPVVYFNLQGMRVDNPANGIYIKRQGSKATKVYVR